MTTREVGPLEVINSDGHPLGYKIKIGIPDGKCLKWKITICKTTGLLEKIYL